MTDLCIDCRCDLALPGEDRCKWCKLERAEEIAAFHAQAARLTAQHEREVIAQDERTAV